MAESSDNGKISVLFCCLGNICRSTMAEGVFQSLAQFNPRVGTIDSCGTGAYHIGNPPNPKTMTVLARHFIRDYKHTARQVRTSDFYDFDYIFGMDEDNLDDLKALQRRIDNKGKKSTAKVMLFGEFGGSGSPEEVVDPYYGPDSGFDAAYEQVNRFSINFLRDVVDKNN